MAYLHTNFPLQAPSSAGAQCERAIVSMLEDGLPKGFDLFHNIAWSVVSEGVQHIGEVDIVVVAPSGHILLLEVKAGDVIETPDKLLKHYGSTVKDVGAQVRRQHASLLKRIQNGDLPKVHIGTLLVLPNYRIAGETVAYPRERIVDASDMGMFCTRVIQSFSAHDAPEDVRQRVIDFLLDHFKLVPDVATHIGQVQKANAQLGSGMAQWVPNVQHAQGAYVIEGTAGSGKTQLALVLLQRAAREKLRARYVCYNRPLADHLSQVAPAVVEVSTFHQLCREHVQRVGMTLDFGNSNVFEQMAQRYVQDAGQLTANFDLLIVDESQDFDPAWVHALVGCLKPEGKLYLMGDGAQKLYERESFDAPDAVHIRCMDNFRSPRAVVREINDMGLTPHPIEARSAYEGTVPTVHLYGPKHGDHLTMLNRCLTTLWADGYQPEQVVVLSFHGIKTSQTLTQVELGGYATRRPTGQYDAVGNACWTEGRLLVDTLHRFKGQSAPAVVLCEVDFDELTDKDKRKLFVGLTRAQHRVDVVMLSR